MTVTLTKVALEVCLGSELDNTEGVLLGFDRLDSDEIVQKAAADALTTYGHVDVLVNNAGNTLAGYGPIEEVRWDQIA